MSAGMPRAEMFAVRLLAAFEDVAGGANQCSGGCGMAHPCYWAGGIPALLPISNINSIEFYDKYVRTGRTIWPIAELRVPI